MRKEALRPAEEHEDTNESQPAICVNHRRTSSQQ